MIPKAGQFIAVHSHGFIPEGIQFFETIQEIREGDLKKNELIFNHIAALIHDEKGVLCVYEMVAEGCIKTPWELSRYYLNGCNYVILELVEDFTPYEMLEYTIAVRKDLGVKYDFAGIVSHIIYSLIGLWFGRTGKDAKRGRVEPVHAARR